MAAPYPQHLRDQVLAAYKRGWPTKQIAEVLLVSPAWARRVKQRARETGQTTAQPMGGIRRQKVDTTQLTALVRRHPDATTKELHQLLGVACAESTVGMALKRARLTFKKRQSMLRSKNVPMSRIAASFGRCANDGSKRKT